tara:strand:+ start:3702 stop:5123 length:1422 start_codon:yes stop_codon:yes gene_type:complete
MASFVNTTNPTAFGVFDSDTHFQSDADKVLLYVKRKLGDDIMSVELTNKQIWTNFEDATLVFSKILNAHQAESYMSNLMGLDVGHLNTFVKNTSGQYVDENGNVLNIQDTTDPRFVKNNTKTIGDDTTAASPVTDELIGPHGKEQQFPRETLEYLLRRAEPYANEANVGGSVDYVRGFIELKHDVQDYDIYENLIIPGKDSSNNDVKLKLTSYDPLGASNQLSVFNPEFKSSVPSNITPTKIKINEVFHFSPQAAYRFFDTTSAINYLNNQFAFESFTPETVFYVLPVFEDLLRAGQLDISNRVRRSNFSYRLQGKDLRIFPRPTQSNPMNLFVKFSFPADPYRTNLPYDDTTVTGVSNISNVPFANIKYSGINSMSRQWIKQFTLALCKETLGLIRSKFSSVPIPGSDLQMNGSDLISQGREDKEKLVTGLGETLDKVTYQKLLEADAAQSESMSQILKRIPIPNGRAIIIG